MAAWREDEDAIMGIKVRLAMAGLLGAIALGSVGIPAAQAGAPATCRVRNVTQDTNGRSFQSMVEAARDGDRLRVRGTCEGGVRIRTDISIRGMGTTGRPVLTGGPRQAVLVIGGRASVRLRHLVLAGGLGGMVNHGSVAGVGLVVRDNTEAGISNFGSMRLESSVIRGNTGSGYGGGIHNEGSDATLSLVGSRVVGNTTRWGGGGIFNMFYGRVVLIGTVVTRNRANGEGHRRYQGGGINNWMGDDGGGTVVSRRGSSVTGNTPDDCVGTPAC